jgi:hypothetical protein
MQLTDLPEKVVEVKDEHVIVLNQKKLIRYVKNTDLMLRGFKQEEALNGFE